MIYNRTDGDLGKRLDHYTLEVLDARRNAVFQRENLPAPSASAKFELAGGGPTANIRRAAMLALTHVRGKEPETFKRLAAFVKNEADRPAAIRALQRIPRSYWSKDAALPLLDPIVADVKKTPVNQRTKFVFRRSLSTGAAVPCP